jgi:large subunit ribosomal protein L10
MDGKMVSRQQLDLISELPSREVLLAKLLGTLVAVPTQFVTVLSAVPRSLVQVLEAIRQKKEKENQ